MTQRWLLAAEADQIQDLLFRAPHLREVVGGSQLIERFCRDLTPGLLDRVVGVGHCSDLVINRGGAFRVLFNQEEQARDFGEALAELYRRAIGGHLSVAPPVLFRDGDWLDASDRAHRALLRVKRSGLGASSPLHQPYGAICASCGIGLATWHEQRRAKVADERPDYLCDDCRTRFGEPFRPGQGRHQALLTPFRRAVRQRLAKRRFRLDGPEDGDWASMIGKLDSNAYVAYLSADGNGMGRVFSRCSDEKVTRDLSALLTQAMLESLAIPCAELVDRLPSLKPKPDMARREQMPLLPLILGGDDLFALLPARWAVFTAHRFIRAYEDAMWEALTTLKLAESSFPSISAALVICKATYPHALARRRCDRELARAKQLAHREGGGVSSLALAQITGNQTGGGADSGEAPYQATLSPYLLRRTESADPIEILLDFRGQLADDGQGGGLPAKRRAELEDLFDDAPKDRSDLVKRWKPQLESLRRRIGRQAGQDSALQRALDALRFKEDRATGYWCRTPRPWTGNDSDYGHGLPDLLRLWSFLERLDPAGDLRGKEAET